MDNVYYTPATTANNDRLFRDFLRTANAHGTRDVDVPVMMGRTLRTRIPSTHGGGSSGGSDGAGGRARSCWVDFKDLCEGDRGAADYQALCKHYTQVFLANVPVLSVLVRTPAPPSICLPHVGIFPTSLLVLSVRSTTRLGASSRSSTSCTTRACCSTRLLL